MSSREGSNWIPYLSAVASLIVATYLCIFFDQFLIEGHLYYLWYMLAILFTAWHGGFRPSMFAFIVSLPLIAYFFTPPRFDIRIEGLANQIGFGTFCVLALALLFYGSKLAEGKLFSAELERRIAQRTAELHDQTERLGAVLRTASDAIITINHLGTIESANPAAERMFGYTAAEMIGQNVKMLMPWPDREKHDEYLAAYLRTGVKKIIGIGREVLVRHKNGALLPVDLAISEVEPSQVFTGVLRDLSRRRELERQILEIAAMEQRRIGQELHDAAGQELTALGLLADSMVECQRLRQPANPATIDRVVGGIKRLHKHIRGISRGLVTVEVPADSLQSALAELAQQIGETTGIRSTFTCREAVVVTNDVTATHLYHIAQEACTNAVKHAQAEHIEVSLESADNHLILRVKDDGIGFTPDLKGKQTGLGLHIMQNRAGVIQARLSIAPEAPRGTAVTCTLTEEFSHATA